MSEKTLGTMMIKIDNDGMVVVRLAETDFEFVLSWWKSGVPELLETILGIQYKDLVKLVEHAIEHRKLEERPKRWWQFWKRK